MQIKKTGSVLAALILAIILGCLTPSAALADEISGDILDDQTGLAAAPSQEEGQDEGKDEDPVLPNDGEPSSQGEFENENPENPEETLDEEADDTGADPTILDEEPDDEDEESEDALDGSAEQPGEGQDEPVLVPAGDPEPEDTPLIPNGTYMFESVLKSSLVLEVKGGSSDPKANVQVNSANGANAQRWIVTYVGGGYYTIRHAGTNQMLDVYGGRTANKTNVHQYKANGSDAQLWSFVDLGNGRYRIISKLSPTLALDIAGGANGAAGSNVQVYRANDNSNAQYFKLHRFEPVAKSTYTPANGTYIVRTSTNTVYGLDIKGGSKSSGANVQLYTGNTSQAQKFYFKSDGNGYYEIFVIGSGKVLSTSNASVLPGNNVIQANYNSNSSTQKWALFQTASGIEIVNKATGLALDVRGRAYANNTNIHAYTYANDPSKPNSAQQFKLYSRPALVDGIYTIVSFKAPKSGLDVKGGSTGNNVVIQLLTSSDALGQRFGVERVTGMPGEVYRIRTAASGGWLTYSGGKVVQYGNHATAQSNSNLWELVWNGSYFSMSNKQSGTVLELTGGKVADGTEIQVHTRNGSAAQHFYFTPANLIPNRTYKVTSVVGTVLDVKSGSKNSGANIQASNSTNNPAQRFTISSTSASSNTYTIRNTGSGLLLGLSGTNVIQGGSNQRWVAQIEDGGYIGFVNAATGQALEVVGGSSQSGANVATGSDDHSREERWKLTMTGWVIEGGKYYFYDANGQRVKDAGSNKAEWNKSSYESWSRIKDMTSKTEYLGVVDQDRTYTTFYIRRDGVWTPYISWICSVGSSASPTPRGTFKTGNKQTYTEIHEGEHGVWYWTCFNPNDDFGTSFHSVLTDPGSKNIRWQGLGLHNSGGCVRCPMEKAKWVFDNVKRGTTVHIY